MSSDRLDTLEREGGYYPLPTRALLRVMGADRLRFLNGQMSNDLRRLAPGATQPSLVLTAKGKLCALVLVWLEDEAFVVETSAELGETLLARLERYAIADDVIFDLLPGSPAGWHAFGPPAAALQGRRADRLGLPGVDLDHPPAGLAEASPEEIELLRIRHGVPQWGRELDENTLPQEAGLDRTAVDFAKGCYVGQETVSRLKSVGRVNRLLAGFVGAFPPSATLLANAAGEQVGHLTSTASWDEKTCSVALGFLSSRSQDTHFSVLDESGACLGQAERREFPLNFP